MARVVKGYQSVTYIHTRLFANGMNHAFAFPAEAGPHFTDPGGMEGWVDLVGVQVTFAKNHQSVKLIAKQTM